MRSIKSRLSKLEQQCIPQGNRYLPLLVKVTLRRFAREVAAGTRSPEGATEEAALAELRSIPVTQGASLAERMEAAIRRGKARREGQEVRACKTA